MSGAGIQTPWGRAENVRHITPFIAHLTTPSHGGLFLYSDMNKQVPLSWRDASFNGRGLEGWYEEDCDWALVALVFPAFFSKKVVAEAAKLFAAVHAPKLAEMGQ